MQGDDPGLAAPLMWATAIGDGPGGKSLADLPDVRLSELALAGDREAWDALIARHDHRLILSLLARGVRLAQARELAQRTWMRLYAQQRAGRLDRLELPGLAIRQASFLALDDARKKGEAADSAPVPSDAIEMLVDPAAGADERLIRREQLGRALVELERCPPVGRRVFSLVYANPGLPHAEAARRLGLSVQRVRQILCEVRARLRAAIETEPSDD
jgi:DNA-directed RNA polymerase specialized sigma24 family protein